MIRMLLLLGALCLFALPGCGGAADTTLSLSSYKTSCSTAADCVAATIGDVCGCACPNAAINRVDEARYQADYTRARTGCSGGICQADCIQTTVVCAAGNCAIMN